MALPQHNPLCAFSQTRFPFGSYSASLLYPCFSLSSCAAFCCGVCSLLQLGCAYLIVLGNKLNPFLTLPCVNAGIYIIPRDYSLVSSLSPEPKSVAESLSKGFCLILIF